MNKIILAAMFSLSILSCERHDKPNNHSSDRVNSDNTKINVRDRDTNNKTPMDQSEEESDRMITKKIRQALMSDDLLSTNAKNIKIITLNGVVTLRGPVANSKEKEEVEKNLSNIKGILKVDNQLEVIRSNNNQ